MADVYYARGKTDRLELREKLSSVVIDLRSMYKSGSVKARECRINCTNNAGRMKFELFLPSKSICRHLSAGLFNFDLNT